MSDVKRIATRESYGKALVELGKLHENLVVLDADLAGATKTAMFQKEFPERHIDCGIAEGNMIGVAAGLATTGKVPFASSFAMFAAGRAFEQVRNSVGYPKLNVKIGATHAGISVGEDGATHQCNEDIALMLKRYGIRFVKQEESYTSQCSPLSPEVGKRYAEPSNRKERGLYRDGNRTYNADAVGAYNILRKYHSVSGVKRELSVTGLKTPEIIKVAV